ncbi:hypothetical protein P9695_08880 [Weizmannia sp. CD-2023]|uniref:hypothetical protein n=1 Tax=Heyndrickxia TaxID=2837504 RepID=UPI002E215F2E|nr:hypothetical protein [Weizmannia sp. CD-2023]MED4899735.1 hypothetical protein [Weizmannia sp. CD-2023]
MGGIIAIGVIGSTVVGVAMVENKLERIGKQVESETINGIMDFMLSMGGMTGAVWVLWDIFKKLVLFM